MTMFFEATRSGRSADRNSNQIYDEMAASFDADWYAERYLRAETAAPVARDPFTHYLVSGMAAGFSPSAAFDEEFYRVFYPEIDRAVADGRIPGGFYHFVAAGRAEGRLPRYDRRAVLEARMPGVTRPALLERMPAILDRMAPVPVRHDPDALPRVHVLLPTVDPDLSFGGYRSVFELMRCLRAFGHAIDVVCTEDAQANRDYFCWREPSAPLRELMRAVPVLSPDAARPLAVGSADVLLVYSLWDLYAADAVRRAVPGVRVVLLAQEFEPIFHDNCSSRAVLEAAYDIPHYPLINSRFLLRFFREHRIGAFKGDPVPDRDFRVFEHRLNRLKAQTATQMRARRERVLIAYARPEAHAARNMFELLVLALRRVCAEGVFGPEWTFIGLGALVDTDPVELGGGHRMVMHAKMSEDAYASYIGMIDVGVSLMYAPHPSVMPFEFATTGALVVTNTFENRSAAELAAICGNIIGTVPSLDGIAAGLREAVERVPDADARVAAIFRPPAASWSDIFDDALLRTVFGDVPAPAARTGRTVRRAGTAGSRPGRAAASAAPEKPEASARGVRTGGSRTGGSRTGRAPARETMAGRRGLPDAAGEP